MESLFLVNVVMASVVQNVTLILISVSQPLVQMKALSTKQEHKSLVFVKPFLWEHLRSG